MLSISLLIAGCGQDVKGKIYFSSSRFGKYGEPGDTRVGVCVYDGGRVKKLYRYYSHPCATKDGTRLIASAANERGVIGLVDTKRETMKNLRFNHSTSGFNWFSDNKRVACTGGDRIDRFNYVANIYVIDLDTMKEEQLTFYKNINRRIFSIKVSPDNQYLLYSIKNEAKDDYSTTVRLVNLKSRQEEILPFSAGNFVWLPDSKTIVLYGIYSHKGEKEFGPRLITYNIETKKYKKSAKEKGDLGKGSFTISPDGAQIAYMRHERSGRNTMWVMNTDGTNRKKILDDGYQIFGMSWSN